MIFAAFFIFYSTVSQKMDHFDISFACSIFSKSWEVTNYGFLGVAHLPLSPASLGGETYRVSLSAISISSCRAGGKGSDRMIAPFASSGALISSRPPCLVFGQSFVSETIRTTFAVIRYILSSGSMFLIEFISR